MTKATITVRVIGQQFAHKAVVRVNGIEVHETSEVPYGMPHRAVDKAVVWCKEHLLDVTDPT